MTMKETKRLISLRVSERDWDDFMAWADSRGSNASAEINRFIKQSLGRIDSDIQLVNTGQNVNTDLVTRDDLSKEIEKAVTYLFQDLAHKSELRESVNAIADLTSQLSELKGEVEQLKESEPVS